jgi:hypothetical protein
MFLSRSQNSGLNPDKNMDLSKTRKFHTPWNDSIPECQNCIHEDIKIRLNLRNDRYRSIQNNFSLLLS